MKTNQEGNMELQRYFELYDQKAEIEQELKSLSSLVLKNLTESGESKAVYGDRSIVKCTRKTWSYPPHIKNQEQELKSAQKIAQLDGTAEPKETEYLTVKKA